MLKKLFGLTVFSILVLGLSAVMLADDQSGEFQQLVLDSRMEMAWGDDDDDDDDDDDEGSPNGVFLGTATGLGEPIHFLVTLERDGIFTASDTTDFGVGGIGGSDSDQHGTWRMTGGRQITARSLFFSHDSASGGLVAVARNTSVVDFNSSFTDGTGTITVEVFAPFQVLDPLNPNTEEDPLGGAVVVELTLKRLE